MKIEQKQLTTLWRYQTRLKSNFHEREYWANTSQIGLKDWRHVDGIDNWEIQEMLLKMACQTQAF